METEHGVWCILDVQYILLITLWGSLHNTGIAIFLLVQYNTMHIAYCMGIQFLFLVCDINSWGSSLNKYYV